MHLQVTTLLWLQHFTIILIRTVTSITERSTVFHAVKINFIHFFKLFDTITSGDILSISFINDTITLMDIAIHIDPTNKVNIHYKVYVSHIKGQPAPGSQASKTHHRDPLFVIFVNRSPVSSNEYLTFGRQTWYEGLV